MDRYIFTYLACSTFRMFVFTSFGEFSGKGGPRELESAMRLAVKWFDFGRVCEFVEDRKVDNWSRRKVKREVW